MEPSANRDRYATEAFGRPLFTAELEEVARNQPGTLKNLAAPLPLERLPEPVLPPDLRAEVTGGPAFGAVMLGIASLLLCGFGQTLRLPRWLRIPIVLIVILHPVTLSHAAMGSPLVLLLVAVIGIAKSLAAWGDYGRLRDLIGCSLYCAVACLTRYDAVFLVAAAAVYVGIRSGMGKEGGYSRVEGLLITFLLPVIYFGGLWIGANWLIMGDPWHFLRGLGDTATQSTDAWQAAVLTLPLLVFPFCYVLAYHELRPFGPWRGGAAAALRPARPSPHQ